MMDTGLNARGFMVAEETAKAREMTHEASISDSPSYLGETGEDCRRMGHPGLGEAFRPWTSRDHQTAGCQRLSQTDMTGSCTCGLKAGVSGTGSTCPRFR